MVNQEAAEELISDINKDKEDAAAELATFKANQKKMVAREWTEIDQQETEDESVRRETVFFEITRIFLGILKNGESTNLKVKHIALYKLFPKLVNISLPFLNDTHSNEFLRILVRGNQIEWGSDSVKMKHFVPHLSLARELLKSGGIKFNQELEPNNIKNLKRVMMSFQRCYLATGDEKIKR